MQHLSAQPIFGIVAAHAAPKLPPLASQQLIHLRSPERATESNQFAQEKYIDFGGLVAIFGNFWQFFGNFWQLFATGGVILLIIQ